MRKIETQMNMAIKSQKNWCSGNTQVITDNGISRILGVMPLATPIKITHETVGLQIKYNNTRGLAKSMTSTTNMIGYFDSAFFDFDLIAR